MGHQQVLDGWPTLVEVKTGKRRQDTMKLGAFWVMQVAMVEADDGVSWTANRGCCNS